MPIFPKQQTSTKFSRIETALSNEPKLKSVSQFVQDQQSSKVDAVIREIAMSNHRMK